MKLEARYFASLREQLGCDRETLDAPVATLGELRSWLRGRGDPYTEALAPGRALRMALDQVMADEATPLRDGAEVAFFPPVTGG